MYLGLCFNCYTTVFQTTVSIQDYLPPAASSSASSSPPQQKKGSSAAKIARTYKTSLCRWFSSTGHCPYGASCHYAHGAAQLRERRPESDTQAQQMCLNWLQTNTCPYGNRCRYLHTTTSSTSQQMEEDRSQQMEDVFSESMEERIEEVARQLALLDQAQARVEVAVDQGKTLDNSTSFASGLWALGTAIDDRMR